MNTAQLIALVVIGSALLLMLVAMLAVVFTDANRKLDRLILTDLTDDEPFDDLAFRRHTDVALAILQPDSELLPAEEA